jgi:hypothetical protein
VSFTGFDQSSEMIIFESILTTFIASVILETVGAVAKIQPIIGIFSLLKSMKHTVKTVCLFSALNSFNRIASC